MAKIKVNNKGLFTIQKIKPPFDGSIISFECEGGYIGNKIYTCVDRRFVGPYEEASYIKTGIGYWEFFQRGRHEAFVFVISESESMIKEVMYAPNPRLIYIDGKVVSLKLVATFNSKVRVRDSEMLLEEYVTSKFRSAEERVRAELEEFFIEEVNYQFNTFSEQFSQNYGQQLDALSKTISDDIRRRIDSRAYPWIELTSSICRLRLFNLDEILGDVNYTWTTEEKNKQKDRDITRELKADIIRMMTKAITRRKVTPEVEGIFRAFMENIDDVSTENLKDLCKFLHEFETYPNVEDYIEILRYMSKNML